MKRLVSFLHRAILTFAHSLALSALAHAADLPPRVDAVPSRPEENRFTRKILLEALHEPMQLEFDALGRVYWIERSRGGIRRFDDVSGQIELLGTLAVDSRNEGGLIGFLLARDFLTSRQIYVCYAPPAAPGQPAEMRLARFTLHADEKSIDLTSEKVFLRWPWEPATHMGGGMVWDAQGNLYLSTGDDTIAGNYSSGLAVHEPQPGIDSSRSSGSTLDLRGKILRIHPEPDGTYTIPDGNLFPPGLEKTRPEIYTMGNRNPWRLSIDSRTGFLHWGEVGPDAGVDSEQFGPRGYDEFNVAKHAGNFGWPFLIGHNRAYRSYDYTARKYGAPFDPARPVNLSPNNTGLRELPPAQPPLIAYPYAVFSEFPVFTGGGRCAVGGPVFHRSDFLPAAWRVFPDYFEDKWFIADFVRNWIMMVTMNSDRTKALAIERFMADEQFNSIVDLDFGPNGDLYVLEYGKRWGQNNSDSRLTRIEFNRGNRAPVVQMSASRTAGAAPLTVSLSADGTIDHDGDKLQYDWVIFPPSPAAREELTGPNPLAALRHPGTHKVVLNVTDTSGQTGRAELDIVVGNEPPEVKLEITQGNRSFFFPGQTLSYRAIVRDQEDGTLANGGIAASNVYVTAEYVPSGITGAEMAAVKGAFSPTESFRHVRALAAMSKSDCRVCHQVDTNSVGPAFIEVAKRYHNQAGAVSLLAQKVLVGGSGVWGTNMGMVPHPNLTPAEATSMVEYILSLASTNQAPERLNRQGDYQMKLLTLIGDGPNAPTQSRGGITNGSYVLRTSYKDQGASGVEPILAGEIVLLRSPRMAPESAEIRSPGIHFTASQDPGFFIAQSGSYIGFQKIDLTGIRGIEISALTKFYNWPVFQGATISIRLDAPTGKELGTLNMFPVTLPQQPNANFGDQHVTDLLGITGATGTHDVYFVFENRSAKADNSLLLLTSIEFKQNASRPGVERRP